MKTCGTEMMGFGAVEVKEMPSFPWMDPGQLDNQRCVDKVGNLTLCTKTISKDLNGRAKLQNTG